MGNNQIIKYKNESFGRISKDISLDNLTYNKAKSSSQIYMNHYQTAKLLFYKFVILKNAYKNDNTNLDIIEEFGNLKKQLNEKNHFKCLKEINEILELYDPFIINKTINKTKDYQISKIFGLIDLLKNYNEANIFDKYQIEQYLINFNKTNKIGDKFNLEISSENEAVYIYTLYYSWVTRLIKILEEFNSQTYENYYEQDLMDKYYDIANLLGSKKRDIIKVIKGILGIKDDVEEENLKVMIDKEINTNKKIIEADKAKKLQDLNDNLKMKSLHKVN